MTYPRTVQRDTPRGGPPILQPAREPETPVVIRTDGGETVVYGPGLDDINEWNDPC